jgi:hypothetical protein
MEYEEDEEEEREGCVNVIMGEHGVIDNERWRTTDSL